MDLPEAIEVVLAGLLGIGLLAWLGGVRRVPHDRVGLAERRWSRRGRSADRLAHDGAAGFLPRVLEGGLHCGLFPWQYRVHRLPLVRVAEGRIGYLYAREGAPLEEHQALGRVVPEESWSDVTAFLAAGGQRGRQRSIMREGLHAVHLAQFVVLTEDEVAAGPGPAPEKAGLEDLRRKLVDVDGFAPVVVGVRSADEEKRDGEKGKEEPCLPETPSGTLGVVTVHDGPPADGSRRPHREDREDRLDVEDPEGFLAGGSSAGR